MITRATAERIWAAYREIEIAEKLLTEIPEIQKRDGLDKHAPSIGDAFGRVRHFQLGIPSGDNGHRLLDVRPQLALSVIAAHLANKKAELAEANEQARIELEADRHKSEGE